MRTLIRHFQGVIHAITPNNGNRRALKNAHMARRLKDPNDPDQSPAVPGPGPLPDRPYQP